MAPRMDAASRHADDGCFGRYVVDDYSPRSDYGASADPAAWKNDRAGSDQCVVFDLDIAVDQRPRRDRHEVADAAIMGNDRLHIEMGVAAERHIGGDHCSRGQKDAWRQSNVRTDLRRGMDQRVWLGGVADYGIQMPAIRGRPDAEKIVGAKPQKNGTITQISSALAVQQFAIDAAVVDETEETVARRDVIDRSNRVEGFTPVPAGPKDDEVDHGYCKCGIAKG